MNHIKLKSLTLLNFKGIRNLTITEFNETTNIYGANGTGKTTVFDSFTWLLFGKDSQDRTTFEIKTLDKNNEVISKLDHEVMAILDVNGEFIEVKRTYREKWVTKRGSEVPEFTGHETQYHWNEVPLSQKEFNAKVAQIIDEKIFKLISNPAAFNSLKWQDQRQVLTDISGQVTDADVAIGNDSYTSLLAKIGTNKTIEEYQKQLKATIKKSKTELKEIPSRIDEVERGKPETKDFEALRNDRLAQGVIIGKIDDQMQDKLKAQQAVLQKRSEIEKAIHTMESEINKIKHEAKESALAQHRTMTSGANDIQAQITEKKAKKSEIAQGLESLKTKRKLQLEESYAFAAKANKIRDEWNARNAETFVMDADDCACPTCKREFDVSDIDAKKAELEKNFKENQAADLKALTEKGQGTIKLQKNAEEQSEALEARVTKGAEMLDEVEKEILLLEENLKEVSGVEVPSIEELTKEALTVNQNLTAYQNDIAELKAKLEKEETVNVDDLKAKKEEAQAKINAINTELQAESSISRANERKEELSDMEKSIAQTIASYEGELFTIESFIKEKVDRLEKSINERFSLVNFKMFESQINGGEVETCKALINGVPFSDANTASKINAGIDIINTLSAHYGITAPIFIDNRESVVNLIDSPSQIINLIVSGIDKELRVESDVEQLETV